MIFFLIFNSWLTLLPDCWFAAAWITDIHICSFYRHHQTTVLTANALNGISLTNAFNQLTKDNRSILYIFRIFPCHWTTTLLVMHYTLNGRTSVGVWVPQTGRNNTSIINDLIKDLPEAMSKQDLQKCVPLLNLCSFQRNFQTWYR